MKSLIPDVVYVRGEVISDSFSAVPKDTIVEKGSRVGTKVDRTWKKRSEVGRKRNVVAKRNTPKRVLTPGKDDPTAGHKKLYTRQGRKTK